MFVVSAARTMAGARPKVAEKSEPFNLIEAKKRHALAQVELERRKIRDERASLESARVQANEAMRAANEALGKLHALWAVEGKLEGRAEMRRRDIVAPLSVQTIIQRISKALKVSVTELKSTRRDSKLVLARHAIMYWSVRRTTRSLCEIGRQLGDRDHTTVRHGRETYPAKRKAMGRTLREVR